MRENPTHRGKWNVSVRLPVRCTLQALLIVLLLGASGCERNPGLQSPTSPGSPGGTPSPSPAPLNLTGTWKGSLTDNGTAKNEATIQLTHTNNDVTGTINWVGVTTATGTVTGTVSGKTLTFRISIPMGGFTSPAASRFCMAQMNGTTASVSADQIDADYTGTNTCSALVPFPGALHIARN